LAYADDVNSMGDDIRALKKSGDMLINVCKNIDLTVNIENIEKKVYGSRAPLEHDGK
jgi:hypothetical protein